MVSHIFLCFPFIPCTLTILDILFTDDMNTSPGVASTDTGEKSATMRANKRARIVKADDVMTVALPQRKPAMAAVDEKMVCSADKEVTVAKKKVDTAEEEVTAAKNKVDTAEKKVHKAEKKVRKAEKKVDRADKEVAAAKRKVKTAEEEVAAAKDATADVKKEAMTKLAKAETNWTEAKRDFAKAELELAEANVKLAEVAKYSDAEITKLMGIVTRHDRILKTAQDLYDQFVNPSASSINASRTF
jgi:chromosome segregation ATPase